MNEIRGTAEWAGGRASPTVVDVTAPSQLENDIGEFFLQGFLIRDSLGRVAEHVAIGTGELGDGMLFRANSACVTSEVFGCRRCDCRWQLSKAFEHIAAEGRGLVTYHPSDEGRGVGLFNKLRTFAVMDERRQTSAEAFTTLGLCIDQRGYAAAVAILRYYRVGRVRILTNNPEKLSALAGAGITIEERVPIVAHEIPSLTPYLTAKRIDLQHLIDLSADDAVAQ